MEKQANSEAMLNAQAALAAKDHEQALEWFDRAAKDDPNNIKALMMAGNLCISLGKNNAAVRYYSKAYELAPDSGNCAFFLGNAYFVNNDTARAFELYTEAEMKGCTENVRPKLYYHMAMLCGLLGDSKGALVNMKKYEDLDKTGEAKLSPSVLSEKMKLYILSGDTENAEKCAVKLISL